MVAYCTTADLLIDTELMLPAGISKESFVQRAADEIDVKISRLYATPVVFNAEGQTTYSATLKVLKMINAHLATGRLILAMNAGDNDNTMNTYGVSLIREAQMILQRIADQEIILEGAAANALLPGELEGPRALVYQGDSASGVETFYDLIATPTYRLG